MKQNGLVNRTKMADALTRAFYDCQASGGRTGRVGHRILTNNAAVGLNGKPAVRRAHNKKEDDSHTAVSAVSGDKQ